ncbi:MAG: putative metal-binding motif-containing protein [Pseudomonadota bacterium]|nr:putative metal-binding motif-containing protein [Pseudomonadota bacterium]
MSDTAGARDTASGDGCIPEEEVPYNGRDEDCDGSDLVDVDRDGSNSVRVGGEDCDDADASVSPGADEACGNLVDDDCDGVTDEGCGVASAGTPDPGGISWICGLDAPGPGSAALLVALAFALLRRHRRENP